MAGEETRQGVREPDGAGQEERRYTVTELADALGITARTLRFYEDKGLLQPARVGTTRMYTHRDRARMMLILRGKRLGFSLRDIRDYLDLYKADVTGAEQIRLLLRAVRGRIHRLEEQSAALIQTLDELRAIETQASEALEARTTRRRSAA
jgi:DNA-binding transcriptional MerR regulator